MSTQQLHLPDGTIAYDLSGPADGRLAVLVHGLGDTRASYRFLAPALAAAGFRVATMDVRGYGDSSLNWPEYSTPAVARDITELVRHLTDRPAVLAGHSFAAGAVAMVAGRNPELVDRLVMLGPAVTHEPMNPFLGTAAKFMTAYVTPWIMYYRSLYPGPKPADFTSYLSDLKASLKRPGRMVPVKRLMASLTPANDADLSLVTAPTAIVMGGKDGDFADPAAEADKIAADLAGPAEVTVLPVSGHYPHADDAKATNSIVVRFLTERRD
ncbi:pimeloyl-ACP methyl ester carboxylesterase [Stackebrandtia endophytica]|uniref:Pimeloyl-ACP methyl ester carboxylesterase n=1 Tax=Stackebrandtia endophytica TaxID=1496996 RepID=A0A543B1Z8_9ACTN|nr:alpha/beta hydrolase [Stackebrandtia endophytica]TQL78750.1 pimeloyl-ACP methyl ester carboxylesterase [Stackebrandtia endophytica]